MYVCYPMILAKMEGTILCVIDFSDSSRKTLQWAIDNASETKSRLTVLYPYRLMKLQNGESAFEMRKKIEDEARLRFHELETELLADAQIPYEFKTEVGFLANRVEAHSKTQGVNVLVVNRDLKASHKESFDDLVDRTQIPVIIIP